jgi:hypothetical protein
MTVLINEWVRVLINNGTENLIFIMAVVFVFGVTLKVLLYVLVRSELNLSLAIETRTHRYLERKYEDLENTSGFHAVVESILKRTYEEVYIRRKKMLRKRKGDPEAAVLHKVFLIEDGVRTVIKDTLNQTKYHQLENTPDFKSIAKYVFGSNPYFTRLWGFLPVGTTNSVLGILPGLFIVGGILGTFLGISKGLPALKAMDPGNVTAAQATLGHFLESMTFAMNSSVIGIFLSVCFTILNSFLSVNSLYVKLVDRYVHSLELLWKDTSNNG